MRVLVACEYSGRVREAFAKRGHEVLSCDLRPTEQDTSNRSKHYQGDVRDVLYDGWDLLVAHPYCTFNTLAGIRWMYHPEDTHLPAEQRRRHPQYPNRMRDFEEGVEFFNLLQDAPIDRICLENSQPHGLAMSRIGRYTQTVHPWMFGEPYTKGACLWLKNLPKLVAKTKKSDFSRIEAACHNASPGPDRERERSRTYQGIANAFAEQWG